MVLATIAKRLFGSVNDRIIKSFQPYVDAINILEAEFSALSDTDLKNKTEEFKKRLQAGETLDNLLVESFAVVREASKRTLGLRHFDVQLLGGIALHKGMIAEMRTGEGKTLVETLPGYLNALTEKGVHIVTANDYLAKRDSEWVGKIFTFLGLSVGCIVHSLNETERKAAYNCDITYATNNELGFDYLRDNMKYSREHFVQRSFNYAIIDEVDSILIDEARTPLIISGPTEDNSELYNKINKVITNIKEEDYDKDEKSRSVSLNDDGINKIEALLRAAKLLPEDGSLYDIEHISLVHHINQALKAHKLFRCDVDYMLKDNKVLIIDEFTGRIMEGRRYSEGLHQAIEAKENVPIQNENQTLASITFQNYFRLYLKLAGMTGTAMTEATEFRDIYKLEVVDIPTNVQVIRKDVEDEVYRTAQEKYQAILKEIEDSHNAGQPILVGTVSIEKSEYLSQMLKKKNIPHQVLNAKYHEQEAYIIAQAGHSKAVTIATNMAGRGTDIKLGGNPDMIIDKLNNENMDAAQRAAKAAEIKNQVAEDKQKVIEAGGLLVIGTERHESRRIDNQLRGRSGRQGDPGRTKFFLSLEDDLMRIFGSDKISSLLYKLGLKEGEAIFHPMLSKALEKAQQRVEGFNYEIRKNLLKYDDVMNDQRKIVYEQRIDIIDADDVKDTLQQMYTEVCNELVATHIPENAYYEAWDIDGLTKEVHRVFGLNLPIDDWAKNENTDEKDILAKILKAVEAHFEHKDQIYDHEVMKMARKRFLLLTLDQLWKDHLYTLDQLRQGINLRAYGQRDPLAEYKREAFMMFGNMLNEVRNLYVERMAHLAISHQPAEDSVLADDYAPKQKMQETRIDPAASTASASEQDQAVVPLKARTPKESRDKNDPTSWGRVGRNESCPCGSGQKFKHCHGQL